MAGLLNIMVKKMMNRIISSLCLLILGGTAFSQESNPPGDVRESFHKDYPHSQPAKWNEESEGYNVNFNDRDNDNGESVAHYHANGKHVDTHTYYDYRDIPQPVTEHMNRKYSGAKDYRVVRIERHTRPDMYEVHFTHKMFRHEIYVDEHGREHEYHDYH
jgi:hypothetical protein